MSSLHRITPEVPWIFTINFKTYMGAGCIFHPCSSDSMIHLLSGVTQFGLYSVTPPDFLNGITVCTSQAGDPGEHLYVSCVVYPC